MYGNGTVHGPLKAYGNLALGFFDEKTNSRGAIGQDRVATNGVQGYAAEMGLSLDGPSVKTGLGAIGLLFRWDFGHKSSIITIPRWPTTMSPGGRPFRSLRAFNAKKSRHATKGTLIMRKATTILHRHNLGRGLSSDIAPVRAESRTRGFPEEERDLCMQSLIKSVTCTCSEISIDGFKKASFPSENGNCCGRPTWLVYRLPPLRLKRARERSASMMRDAAWALSARVLTSHGVTIGGRAHSNEVARSLR